MLSFLLLRQPGQSETWDLLKSWKIRNTLVGQKVGMTFVKLFSRGNTTFLVLFSNKILYFFHYCMILLLSLQTWIGGLLYGYLHWVNSAFSLPIGVSAMNLLNFSISNCDLYSRDTNRTFLMSKDERAYDRKGLWYKSTRWILSRC